MHYTKVKTKIKNKDILVKALADMGFTKEFIKVHDKPTRLQGYHGDMREETAEIVLPRKFVGGSSNDIGFKLQEDGTWEAIISEFDGRSGSSLGAEGRTSGVYKGSQGYGESWRKVLYQRYSLQNMKEEIENSHFYIENETYEDGKIVLECSTTMFEGGY